MKNKPVKIEKDFDTVKTFREIKEKISLELVHMSFEEVKEYLKKRSKLLYQKL
jgi:hypothetical protein